MDVLLSNTPAIIFGLWLVDRLGIRRYDWLGRDGKNSIWEWDVWQCHRRFGVVMFANIALTLHFLDGFFIMNAFLIPPVHKFPIFRLILWFCFGAAAYREAYIDIETFGQEIRRTNPIEARLRWLTLGILVTELLIAYKYRKGTGHITDEPTPIYIWFPWLASIIGCALFWVYLRFKPDHTVKYPGHESTWKTVMVSGHKTQEQN